MTSAQKIAKEKFKKAIAYRQKSGVSLKEAFAHVYGKKKIARKKVAKKRISGPKDSLAVKKELARKGLKMPHGYTTTKRKRKISGVKKKKISEQSILNKIHKVKDDVSKLDEAQHKHMMGSVHHITDKYIKTLNEINQYRNAIKFAQSREYQMNPIEKKKAKSFIIHYKKVIKELTTHAKELKKLL